MTVSEMAVGVAMPHGAATGSPNARPRARARARTSIAGAVTQRARRRGVPLAGVRRLGRVVYLDAADSWIVQGRTLSMVEVWRADYVVPGNYTPFRIWCRAYRYPATVWAAGCDAVKFLGVHPVRGPLTLIVALITAALIGLAVTT